MLAAPLQVVTWIHDYLNGHGYGLDDIWDEQSDLMNALPVQREGVVVEPEFTHEEERSTKEFPAICRYAAQMMYHQELIS